MQGRNKNHPNPYHHSNVPKQRVIVEVQRGKKTRMYNKNYSNLDGVGIEIKSKLEVLTI